MRERYLRDDIPCRSSYCNVCDRSLPALLAEDSTYLIPDETFVLHYLEILVCYTGSRYI